MKNNNLTDQQNLIAIHSVIDFTVELPLEILVSRTIEPIHPVTISERIVN